MRITGAAALLAALIMAACAEERAVPRQVALASVVADTVVVYKSPTCGCCKAWVDHMRAHGFVTVSHDIPDAELAAKKHELGVPAGRISCHTATVRGYTLEGHVPADLVRRLIDEKSRYAGLAVPGMPIGSPGMEGAFKQEYDVLAFDRAGNVSVYERR